MNDMTYAAYTLDQHRAADLERQNEQMRIHRERGTAPTRPHGRPLAEWLRSTFDRSPRRAAAA